MKGKYWKIHVLFFGGTLLGGTSAWATPHQQIFVESRASASQEREEFGAPLLSAGGIQLRRVQWTLAPSQSSGPPSAVPEIVSLAPDPSSTDWMFRLSWVQSDLGLVFEPERSLAWTGLGLGRAAAVNVGVLAPIQGLAGLGGDTSGSPLEDSRIGSTFLERNQLGAQIRFYQSEVLQWDVQVGRGHSAESFLLEGWDSYVRALLTYGDQKTSLSLKAEKRVATDPLGWRAEVLSQHRYSRMLNIWQAVVWRPSELVQDKDLKLAMLWQAVWNFEWANWVLRGEIVKRKSQDFVTCSGTLGPQWALGEGAVLLKTDYTIRQVIGTVANEKSFLARQVFLAGVQARF